MKGIGSGEGNLTKPEAPSSPDTQIQETLPGTASLGTPTAPQAVASYAVLTQDSTTRGPGEKHKGSGQLLATRVTIQIPRPKPGRAALHSSPHS